MASARAEAGNPLDKWAGLLAASLVVHSPMPEPCLRALEDIFVGVDDLWVVLANGGPSELECIPIITESRPVAGPLVADWRVPPGLPSLCRQVMDSCGVTELHLGDEGSLSPSYSDWEELHRRSGCSWVQAAAVSCDGLNATMGAVLLAGRQGAGSPIDPEWLDDWGCEMARCIAHASVHVMEASLDVLRMIFSPQTLEQLVTGAVRSRSPRHLAAELGTVAACVGENNLSRSLLNDNVNNEEEEEQTAAGPGRRLSSASGSVDLTAVLPPPQLMAEGNSSATANGGAPSLPSSVGPGATPFAATELQQQRSESSAQASVDEPAATSTAALRDGGIVGQEPTPRAAGISAASTPIPSSRSHRRQRSGSSAPGVIMQGRSGSLQETALQLVRLGSAASARAGTGSPLAALRAPSVGSDTTALFTDAEAQSPRSSELLGYEDLLAEDRAEHARRMPSASLERAQSRCSADRERDNGAGVVLGDNDSRNGNTPMDLVLGGAGSEQENGSTLEGQQQHHVTGQQPVVGDNILPPTSTTTTQRPEPSLAMHHAALQALSPGRIGAPRLASIAELNSSGSASSSLAGFLGTRRDTTSLEAVAANLAADALINAQRTASGNATLAGGEIENGSLLSSSGSLNISSSNLAAPPSLQADSARASRPVSPYILPRPPSVLLRSRQGWNLMYADGDLESAYEDWSSALSLQSDAFWGTIFSVFLAFLAETLLRAGALMTLPGLTLAIMLAVLSFPAAASWIHPEAWARHRVGAVLTLRLLCCALTFAQVASSRLEDAATRPASFGYGLVRAMQQQSPMLAMITVTMCYRLPLALNVPLQLACCWMSYTLYTLIWGDLGAGQLALTLATGFCISNSLAFWIERNERRRFLYSSARVEAVTLEQEQRYWSSGSGSGVAKAAGAAVAAADEA